MTDSSFYIPSDVLKVMTSLLENGIKVYPVGGCVRDFVSGRTPADWDAAAEAEPEELRDALTDFSCSCEGIKFGTVHVHLADGDVEITCCRRESGYSDCRRPDNVEYTKSIHDDLSRRDFTVNAMAYDIENGCIIDPYGGMEDIRQGVIRCVGEPRRRFSEDALRILRAVRFSSTLGYSIDEKTESAIHDMRDRLSSLSGERVFSELKKLLCGDNVFQILMNYSDIICTVVPELERSVGFDQHNPHHIYTVYEHIARTVAALPKDPVLRLTMLFHDMAKPYVCTVDSEGIFHFRGHPEAGAEMAEKVLHRLRADKDTVRAVHFYITYHDVRPTADKKSIHRYMCKTGYEGAKQLLHIRRADLSAQSPAYHDGFEYIDRCEELIEELHSEGAALKISDLKISGDELISLGIPEGRKVGETLQRLLDEVTDGTLENEKEALTRRVLLN